MGLEEQSVQSVLTVSTNIQHPSSLPQFLELILLELLQIKNSDSLQTIWLSLQLMSDLWNQLTKEPETPCKKVLHLPSKSPHNLKKLQLKERLKELIKRPKEDWRDKEFLMRLRLKRPEKPSLLSRVRVLQLNPLDKPKQKLPLELKRQELKLRPLLRL